MRRNRFDAVVLFALTLGVPTYAAAQYSLEGPVLPLGEDAPAANAGALTPIDNASPPANDAPATLERDAVYRYVPAGRDKRLVQRLEKIAPDELVDQRVYLHYDDRLGRHVWGLYVGDGRFRYAIGEGSTLRVELFEINLNEQERQEVLEAVAPRLKQKLEDPEKARNVNLYLRLNSGNQWELAGYSALPLVQSIFDLETGHRWEWHGARRHAVLHTLGDVWQVIDGRYVPTDIVLPPIVCGRRAGSAMNVVRTPSP
ncbi:MAG: hypothetical protein AAF961_16450 [Planctomycetota bacterium]